MNDCKRLQQSSCRGAPPASCRRGTHHRLLPYALAAVRSSPRLSTWTPKSHDQGVASPPASCTSISKRNFVHPAPPRGISRGRPSRSQPSPPDPPQAHQCHTQRRSFPRYVLIVLPPSNGPPGRCSVCSSRSPLHARILGLRSLTLLDTTEIGYTPRRPRTQTDSLRIEHRPSHTSPAVLELLLQHVQL